MKVLLSFVGEQDPYSDKTGKEGSIVTLCRHLKPQVVYLFPTAKSFGIKSETQSRALDTETWIKSEIDRDTQVFIIPLQMVDPTDYSAILPLSRRAITMVLQELQEVKCEFHLNCSSGTPQLKSTWLILANAGMLKNCQLWQVANPVFKEQRISRLEVTFLEEENLLSRIKRYSQEFLFQRMAEECLKLKNISLYSYRKEKAEMLYRIFKAYQSWDLICYDDAYKRLYSVYNDAKTSLDLSEVAHILKSQVQVLAKLKENTEIEHEYNLVDLYMNAKRRLKRSDFTETLSRFWRIYEGVLFSHLRSVYKIEPTNLSESIDKTRAKMLLETGDFNPGIRNISIFNAETILSNNNDKVFKRLENIYISAKRGQSSQNIKLLDLLKALREKRNKSIVAHGMKPVEEDDAINCLKAIEIVLKEFILAASNLLNNYPFGSQQLLTVIEVLDKAFSL